MKTKTNFSEINNQGYRGIRAVQVQNANKQLQERSSKKNSLLGISHDTDNYISWILN